MDTVWQDLKYGLRSLRRSPGFAAAAILTLALGVGANAAIFSVFNQVLLRQLPVKNPGELVVLSNPGPSNGHTWSDGDGSESFSFPMYKGLRERNSVMAGLLARYPFTASVTYRNDAEKAEADLVSGNYFEVLGVQPALGRVFSLEDDKTPGAQPVAVLSFGYWLSRFGGDPGILNQTILVDNTALTVVGVTRAGFSGVQIGQVSQIFVPLMMKAQMTPNWNGLDDWNDRWLEVLGRLKPAMTREQAQVGLNVIYKPLLEEQLATIKDWSAQERKEFLAKNLVVAPGGQGHESLQRDAGTPLRALMVLVLLVLVLACANIANLLLARGTARYREFAIRVAMGASRWRMIRQLLAESLICAFAGGVIGLAIASWTLDALVRVLQAGAQIEGLTARLDASVLGFALAAATFSGIIFGLIPAWRVTRTDVSQSLKDQGSTASVAMSHVRFRKGLVATQVAFTVLLLAGAGFFARTLWNLRSVNLGLRADHLVAFTVSPQLGGYSPERTVIFSRQLRERLAALPGVYAVGSATLPSLVGDTAGSNISVPGDESFPDDATEVQKNWVSPGYLTAMGIPLVSGRDFTVADAATSQKVALLSEAAAKHFFPGREALGAHFGFGGGAKPDVEIVGIAADAKQDHTRDETVPFIYCPETQSVSPMLHEVTYYVRTQQDPLAIAASLRKEVAALDPNLPIFDVRTMKEVVDNDLFAERFVASMSEGFAFLAALLSSLGIYGVLAFLVVQRSREIGVRMALGAEARHVRLLIMREVGSMLIIGAAVGLPAAYVLAKLSESLLYGVRARDPLIYLVDIALTALVAFAACYFPVRRATRVDPLVALRYE